MTDAPADRPETAAAAPAEQGESAWERRRRRAAVFGDVLPDTTGDEREPGGDVRREGSSDDWLRAQVPPHHGG